MVGAGLVSPSLLAVDDNDLSFGFQDAVVELLISHPPGVRSTVVLPLMETWPKDGTLRRLETAIHAEK